MQTVLMNTSAQVRAKPVVDEHTEVRRSLQRVRNTLRMNAFTSGAGGLVAAIAPGIIADLLGTGYPGWVRLIGIGLVGFAVSVGVLAGSRASRLLVSTPMIVVADVLWVMASVVTVAAGWFSTSGVMVISAVAAMVATFAVRQFTTHRRARQLSRGVLVAIDESPPIEVANVHRDIDADIDQAWAVVTNHELYGRLAPNLGSVHATAPNGPGLTRTCSNQRGEEWRETCTLWNDEPGNEHRFDVNVDTSNYPYPLALMQGSWWVRPSADNAGNVTVGMDFRYQPPATLKGRLFAVAMQAGFPPVLRKILKGWSRALSN
jgi:hypothetical protein